MSTANLKTAILRSTVGTDKREDWIIDQVDHDIDVMVACLLSLGAQPSQH
jgi:hypothetical protein